MKYYVYILSCSDETFYTGYTNNLRRRLNQHNGKGFFKGAKYTSKRRPVFLEHIENFSTRKDAMKREKEIKHFSHKEKQEIINSATKFEILSAI